MVNAIQGGQSPEPVRPTESKQEREKMFELEWEINLISTYVAVTNQNGNVEHQLNSLKKGLKGGEPPEKLIPAMNQLIQTINNQIPSNAAQFPPFDLTSGGNENKAMAQYALSLEKYLNVAAQQGKISWEKEEALFNQTRSLVELVGTVPVQEAKHQLNGIIAQANQSLPLIYQLQGIGK